VATAMQHSQAFHSHHSSRTFNPGHPEIDPWLRNVLVALQVCLNELATKIDSNSDRLDRVERMLRQLTR
jgi:hypothetical protein